ncbi:MAG: hypothetical protein Q8S21_00780 [Candidatus Paracaedibacteraceae bacterium]|nr:hypothetical protein [Candidatus Paracaedibacteraceae bacterium]
MLCLVHVEWPLPTSGIVAFFALWGLIQSVTFMQSLDDDFLDGTFSYLISERFSIYEYAIARFLTTLICFSLPLIVGWVIGILIMGIDMNILFGLVLNHLQLLLGLTGLQLTFCLTSCLEKKMTNLLIFIPFWIPGFLYLVSSSEEDSMWLSLFGLMILSCGLTILLIQHAYRWRDF